MKAGTAEGSKVREDGGGKATNGTTGGTENGKVGLHINKITDPTLSTREFLL